MRLIHTSDWHLGHALHDHGRELEHRLFLEWLLETIEVHGADALLVTGDVFDTTNPSAAAQAQLYDFVARAKTRSPKLQIVIIGGNHDSVARLDAPEPVLRTLGVRMIGGVRRTLDGKVDVESLLVPLSDGEGGVVAWLAAVPFLRRSDLPPSPSAEQESETLVQGVRAIYDAVFVEARARRTPAQALLAAGHLYVTGAHLSELSERQLFRGHQDALPASVLPHDAVYVALGHLHRAQSVGAPHVRYSGSPIPLAMSERDYDHQVVLVELEGVSLRAQRSLSVPRAVALQRIPERGTVRLAEALAAIAELPRATEQPRERHAYLEIAIEVDAPTPGLRRTLDEAVADKAVRLVRTSVSMLGRDASALAADEERLRDLSPMTIFERMYEERFSAPPPRELLDTFVELESQVRVDKGAA